MKTAQTRVFRDWIDDLKNKEAVRLIRMRIVRIESGNMGDVEPVGDGVYEARIHNGPGYRLYFTRRGKELIILLCGGDKKSQTSDIAKAKQLAKELAKSP